MFFIVAIKPKKILTIIRTFTLYPGKAGSFMEAYKMAEKKIDNEDNGCMVAFMVFFGLSGSIFTLCYLSDVLSSVFQQ